MHFRSTACVIMEDAAKSQREECESEESKNTEYRCIDRLESRRTSLEDGRPSGRSRMSINEENITAAENLLKDEKRLGIGTRQIHCILHDYLCAEPARTGAETQ
ncbi:hypothetical protein Trydic_g19747 [Trypoxylus dichotomus]